VVRPGLKDIRNFSVQRGLAENFKGWKTWERRGKWGRFHRVFLSFWRGGFRRNFGGLATLNGTPYAIRGLSRVDGNLVVLFPGALNESCAKEIPKAVTFRGKNPSRTVNERSGVHKHSGDRKISNAVGEFNI